MTSCSAKDGFDGQFSGLVLAHNLTLALDPLPGLNSTQHTVRLITDLAILNRTNDIGRFARGHTSSSGAVVDGQPGRLLAGAGTKYVETVVVIDHQRFQAFGGQAGLTALAAHSAAVMNLVTTIYRTSPTNGAQFPYTIQVVLTGMHTFIDGDPWENTVTMQGTETDCSSLLSLFNNWGSQQQEAQLLMPHDNRVLLSGRDFDGNTVGLAGVSAMCDKTRSGNVNMCGTTESEKAQCAAVVAHEMGHNFGMRHDDGTSNCPQSGLIMEAIGGGAASTQFSSCSAAYLVDFFSSNGAYDENGQCLENSPTQVYGDPVCANGFVEAGEDCDCGSSDCSSVDPCCDGTTCRFANPSYQCSSLMGTCCDSCMFVAQSENRVCRAARNSCDLPETCPGGTAECSRDVFAYPGSSCTINGFAGLCSSGRCSSLQSTCSVDITRDFQGSWDSSSTCAAYNDECNNLVCHNASSSEEYDCGQSFFSHGKQMPVPDGTPCWFNADPVGTRRGMCHLGMCKQPHALAEVPHCGNGGIDFGEQCDCGSGNDPCCECSTCQLKVTSQCSSLEPCCDPATCGFKPPGSVCRAEATECDLPEVCSGTSGTCPFDIGKGWGESCTSHGVASTCYGKSCLTSLDAQCANKTAGARPFARKETSGAVGSSHNCHALTCCEQCTHYTGNYLVNGEAVTDPVICQGCMQSTSSSTFTVNGQSSTIYLSAPMEGSILSNNSTLCRGSEAVTPNSSCTAGYFLVTSIGKCLACDMSCNTCTGPTNFDCTGACRFGSRDSRGACAISAAQANFSSAAATPSPTPMPSSSMPSPMPSPAPMTVPMSMPVPSPMPSPAPMTVPMSMPMTTPMPSPAPMTVPMSMPMPSPMPVHSNWNGTGPTNATCVPFVMQVANDLEGCRECSSWPCRWTSCSPTPPVVCDSE
eukprot:TRINITY_DN3192_c0_g1_i6.p1 TRINITY_DN3192_c0_g1~~TRINITY_DN3192_c0_g1_i6.p1  ORF type:complete len:1041 (+),score=103.50 TRINITY_DN3192_c0_g1_i6:366-3125(+)